MVKEVIRRGFIKWVDSHADPNWRPMHLTHISKAILADDIARTGKINLKSDDFLQDDLAFLFYGRPAYRVGGDGIIKIDAACPVCFVFRPELVKEAKAIYPFDTGAYQRRMYAHILIDEILPSDYNIGPGHSRINKLINATYGSLIRYYVGDTRHVKSIEEITKPWEYHARAYLHLLTSKGRNEPDDRVSCIEVVFDKPIDIENHLIAIVVPHTHWNTTNDDRADWVLELTKQGVEIIPYEFLPGRHTEHYHDLIEMSLREFYFRNKIL